jgi:DNA-binding winged helix-turn-helix (wHTH) protein
VLYLFEGFTLDNERRELRTDGSTIVPVGPQVFDLLVYLIENRERVVSKDDLIASVWDGRIVSDSTLDSHVNAVRKALGDSGKEQRLIRTTARKGIRFVAKSSKKPTRVFQHRSNRHPACNRRSSSAQPPTVFELLTHWLDRDCLWSKQPIGSIISNMTGKVPFGAISSKHLQRNIS